jgi:hypothetical protein
MILPPPLVFPALVFRGGMLRVRACVMLLRVCAPSTPVRDRERVFIFKRNDGCLGTTLAPFSYLVFYSTGP